MFLKLSIAPQMAFVGAWDMLWGLGQEQQCPLAAVSDWAQQVNLGRFHSDQGAKTLDLITDNRLKQDSWI